jgi:uncharacterized membrane protein
MTLLILGVLLWTGAHLFKRLAPGPRAALGDAGKGVVAIASLVAIVLMVFGYRAADATPLWYFDWAVHLNNLLMVIAIVLLGVGNSKSRLRGKLRHPMLTGAIAWAVAHVLANGDLPSLVLFGGLGLWAIASIILINRAEPAPEPYNEGSVQGDIRLFVISAVIFVVIVLVHGWLGPSPFPV